MLSPRLSAGVGSLALLSTGVGLSPSPVAAAPAPPNDAPRGPDAHPSEPVANPSNAEVQKSVAALTKQLGRKPTTVELARELVPVDKRSKSGLIVFDVPTDQVTTDQDGGNPEITYQSSDGCNNKVCIYITGVKLTVLLWETTALQGPGWTVCDPTANYWQNGIVWENMRAAGCRSTGGGTQTWYSWDGFARNWNDGTKLCNSWFPSNALPGKPCVTIKA
jgi:hypothetical protein